MAFLSWTHRQMPPAVQLVGPQPMRRILECYTKRCKAQEAARVPSVGVGMNEGTGLRDNFVPQRLPGAERGQLLAEGRGTRSG